ncbi:MAG: hypothetical protein KKA79_08550 [Nanoarchaeota archaeon]|nr:hypothetical protein [Nanoarchaeota archaeon]MCG2717316.1 hypothetical protein [Nanoarchaeota archaeon]
MGFRYLTPEKLERAKQKHYESKLRSYKRHLNKQREKKSSYYKIRENLNLIRMSNRVGSQTNTLRWSKGETKQHILKKLEVCMELKELQHEFITEPIFKNGTRADILDLNEGTIYEILHTETEKKFKEKIKNYPKQFRIIKIKSSQ